jgi:hypothetical protein
MSAARVIKIIRVGDAHESGVREAVCGAHVQEVRQDSCAATQRARTELPNRCIRTNATRGPARIVAAALIDAALTESGYTTADLAVALNCSETLARQIRNGERPVELGDAAVIARRLPKTGHVIRRRILELFFDERGPR